MDGRKIKTIVIIILLVVNLAFGGILISEKISEAGKASRERDEIVSVFAASGIDMSPSSIPADTSLPMLELARDAQRDGVLAKALIGSAQGNDQGGGIVLYENSAGWLRLRGGGELEAVVYGVTDAGSPVDAAGSIFAIAGEKVLPDETGLVFCTDEGTRIFNCTVTPLYTDDGLELRGRRLLGPGVSAGKNSTVTSFTALMAFLAHIKDSGSIITRVESVEQGYFMNASASLGTLEPVWRIGTDGGGFFISAMDSRVISS